MFFQCLEKLCWGSLLQKKQAFLRMEIHGFFRRGSKQDPLIPRLQNSTGISWFLASFPGGRLGGAVMKIEPEICKKPRSEVMAGRSHDGNIPKFWHHFLHPLSDQSLVPTPSS